MRLLASEATAVKARREEVRLLSQLLALNTVDAACCEEETQAGAGASGVATAMGDAAMIHTTDVTATVIAGSTGDSSCSTDLRAQLPDRPDHEAACVDGPLFKQLYSELLELPHRQEPQAEVAHGRDSNPPSPRGEAWAAPDARNHVQRWGRCCGESETTPTGMVARDRECCGFIF
jgi:hypothetical protein